MMLNYGYSISNLLKMKEIIKCLVKYLEGNISFFPQNSNFITFLRFLIKLFNYINYSVLQLHPTNPMFWIMASKYEYEINTNIMSARGKF